MKREILASALILASLFGFFLLIGQNPWVIRTKAFANWVLPIFATGFFCAAGFYSLGDLYHINRAIVVVTIILSVIGIAQFILSPILPEKLLILQGGRMLGWSSLNIIRPTALVGNTILYSGLMYLLWVYMLGLTLRGKKIVYLTAFVLASLALFLGFSRYSIVFELFTLAVYPCLFWWRIKRADKVVGWLLSCMLLMTAFVLILIVFFPSSLIVQRFVHLVPSHAGGSAQAHLSQASHAVNVIAKHPWFGLGLGSQGISATGTSIISDGQWFQLLLEIGLPGTVIFWVISITVVGYLLVTSSQNRDVPFVDNIRLTIFFYGSYSLVGGWFNTAFSCRQTYFLFVFMLAVLAFSGRLKRHWPDQRTEDVESISPQ